MIEIFIFAGELSADAHGANLLAALEKHHPNLNITGVAGPELRARGVNAVLEMEAFSVMGFSDVLKSLPRLWRQFRCLREHILKSNPAVALFIDSPSFSLRMARALRQRGYKGKIVQYVSPTVWAWGKDRAHQMANTFDLLLTIYPFEASYYKQTTLRVNYVGNPVQEAIQKYKYDPHWGKKFGIESAENLIAVFPGSRPGEIFRNLPLQLQAIKQMQQQDPKVCIAISCAQETTTHLIQKILKGTEWIQEGKNVFLIPKAYSYDLMRTCRSAIAKSGTVTLELALHQCPTVVTYQLTLLNRLIAKYVLKVKLPHYCIVNILSGKRVFPELIEERFSAKDIYHHLALLHREGREREACIEGCLEVHKLLQEGEASELAATALANELGMDF